MPFYADLHIHSKYSRATSRDCDLENLTYWGRKKGITVIGTGDFTHPAWFAEIQEKLVEAEPGLFKLKPDLEKKISEKLPKACQGTTRFMLSVEISTIYKKGDKVRKIHHLVYAPSFEKAEKIRTALGKIGNIRSDGRPILGLDSRHLLEIVLSAGEDCYLVPAHIWTPWFAVLGSKSGFDDVADCYGDLAGHIHAVETGLSSDPEMNWKVSSLDKYRLMSNSDAHSPAKLGREVNVFHTDLDYYAMLKALQTGKGYGGTLEFFPEEGKYHMDGHRNCGVRFTPEESKAHKGLCPECKKPLTLGVMYRVEELADRHDCSKPKSAADFKNVIPLPEMISEINGVGPSSQAVTKDYEKLLSKLGPELDILNAHPLEQIQKSGSLILSEAIGRMRGGNVIREAGYDGEYGRIKLFKEGELKHRASAGVLFDMEEKVSGSRISTVRSAPARQNSLAPAASLSAGKHGGTVPARSSERALAGPSAFSSLDVDQQKALEITIGPLLILAGPGSGKTRTLTHRVAHLIQNKLAQPEECLTITFTRRAAQEMRERLEKLLPDSWKKIPIFTFHGLALQILQENREAAGLPRGFRIADEAERIQLLCKALEISESKAQKLLRQISRFCHPEPGEATAQTGASSSARSSERAETLKFRPQNDSANAAIQILLKAKETEGWLGYDDLMIDSVRLLEEDAGLQALYQKKFRWVSIDEYQDIDSFQYRLIKLLVPENGNICAIGDPDQAIYSFRGSNVGFFLKFEKDFPKARKIYLFKNYRSGESILSASAQMIRPAALVENRRAEALAGDTGKIVIHHAPTDKAEAEFVAHAIEKMLGGVSFFSLDSSRSDGHAQNSYSFSDFAVLTRTENQAEVLGEALARLGLPFQQRGHADMDLWDPRAERISLLTLHAAKGLEFPVVFIAGCEDGLIPLYWGGSISEQTLAEERRLFYVGMTRAKEKLFLSHAGKRRVHGKIREQRRSPFLQDIEEKLLELSRASFKKAAKAPQLDLFSTQ